MPRLVRASILTLVLAAVVLLSLAIASAALATQRFAAPSGSTTGTCAPPDPPCTLQRAVEDPQTVDGDEVIVAPGDYLEGSDKLVVNESISLHGADGQPYPRIVTNATDAVDVGQDATGALLRRLLIEHDGFSDALLLRAGTAEQIIARSSTGGCELVATPAGTTLRDSVCWLNNASGSNSAIFVSSSVDAVSYLRNVTAIATGSGSQGIFVSGDGNGETTTVDARNVVARGGAPNADVWADTVTGATATVTLGHSNYVGVSETGPGTPSVTDPGTGTNQTSSPVFADPANGDFHQLFGSPTIDAGDGSATLLGTVDIDGDPRTVGAAPDIGADEFVGSPPTPPPASVPSNAFTLGAITRNKKKGTATITVNVPNAGELTASGNGVKAASASRAVISKSVGAGQAQLLIKSTGRKRRKLNETGKAKLNVAVSYTPTGGDASTQSVKVRLKKKL